MVLNQETLPDHILMPLKEAREEWLWRDAPTNPRALSLIAMNEALDNMNEFIANNKEFEEWINGTS